MAQTIEIVRFHLNDGADRDQFLAQNKDIEENFINKQPGLISRETAQNDEGEWMVVLHWQRPEDAQASMNKFVDAQETKKFTALIDMSTFTMARYAKA